MINELQEAEEMLGDLDQHACPRGPALSHAYSRFYEELVKLRDQEVTDWNYEADGGLRKKLFRCSEAGSPYHAQDTDGPCDLYTTDAGVSVCDRHIARAERQMERRYGIGGEPTS